MRGDVTSAESEKTQRKLRRPAAAARAAIVTKRAASGRLGEYESLLRETGDAEVLASLEALLRAVAHRLTRKRVRAGRRKR